MKVAVFLAAVWNYFSKAVNQPKYLTHLGGKSLQLTNHGSTSPTHSSCHSKCSLRTGFINKKVQKGKLKILKATSGSYFTPVTTLSPKNTVQAGTPPNLSQRPVLSPAFPNHLAAMLYSTLATLYLPSILFSQKFSLTPQKKFCFSSQLFAFLSQLLPLAV